MKYLSQILIVFAVFALLSCGGDKTQNNSTSAPKSMVQKEAKKEAKKEVKKEVDPMSSIGVGPITEQITFGELDQALAKKGEELYKVKCTACHKPDKKYIGPAPAGIFERRTPAWVMNMILAPEKMIKEDPTAKKLLMEFNGTPMANQSLTKDQARAILEYFRTL